MPELRILDQMYPITETFVDGLWICRSDELDCESSDPDLEKARDGFGLAAMSRIGGIKGKSRHMLRVERFMRRIAAVARAAGKPERPVRNVIPADLSNEEACFRARIMLEELFEMVVDGLGVDIAVSGIGRIDFGCLEFTKVRRIDPLATLDGACDVFVTTTGTLSCLGIKDEEALRRVDENNLTKFGPGSYIRPDGKLVKSSDFVPVVLDDLVVRRTRWVVRTESELGATVRLALTALDCDCRYDPECNPATFWVTTCLGKAQIMAIEGVLDCLLA